MSILFPLLASVCWTFTALFFATASKASGPLVVNATRLVIASILLWGFALIVVMLHGQAAVFWGSKSSQVWLVLSAFTGLIAGDFLYLKSLATIGARRTTQFLTISPIATVIISRVLFNETIAPKSLAGIFIVASGLILAVMNEKKDSEKKHHEPGTFSYMGYTLCAMAALFHGAGAALVRKAFLVDTSIDPFFAAAFRISSAALMSVVWVGLAVNIKEITGKNPMRKSNKVQFPFFAATLLGPVIGMIFYIVALKSSPAGIVAALSSLSPIMIIPVTSIIYRHVPGVLSIIGTVVAVIGVVVISL
jgi:drug/metabolite transporter (DMT)-like permease